MRSITLKNVSKTIEGIKILDNVSLTIPSGQFFALLGPSGCGKTTLLRLIAGLEDVDSGEIYLGNQNITNVPIHKRPVNIIFQNYALFPHLNVYENIAYSLVIQKLHKTKIKKRVLTLAKVFHLEEHLNKKPDQLSGGQKQRVAIARAIINKPNVLLLDEPLAALDFNLREKLLIELIDLQDALSTTFLYITHDQSEALTVSDHMAIMDKNGNIAQCGTPKEIYEKPKNSYVATFVGNTNLFDGTYNRENNTFIVDGFGSFQLPFQNTLSNKLQMSIRPEKIFLTKQKSSAFPYSIQGTIVSIVYNGRSTLYEVKCYNKKKIQVFEQNGKHMNDSDFDYDDTVYISWQRESVQLLDCV